MPARDVVVVGASAGGLDSLRSFLSGLPATLAAVVLVVLHIPATDPGLLPGILRRDCLLPVDRPDGPAPLAHGRVMVAPADHHLVVQEDQVRLWSGPPEKGHRPAIDVLFRSAARACGDRVIGVVLSGSLDDGTAGALAITQCGGLVVVQAPADAAFPAMPQSVIDHARVDHVAPAAELGPLVARLCGHAPDRADPDRADPDPVPAVAPEPEADSGPWQRTPPWAAPDQGASTRIRAAVALESALWTAVRGLEEKAALGRRLADQAAQRGDRMSARHFLERAHDVAQSAQLVRQMLTTSEAGAGTVADPERSRSDEQ